MRLAAPPVEGAANDALIELLSREFHVPKRQITIVSGATSRDKRVEITGLPDADIQAHLSDILNREK